LGLLRNRFQHARQLGRVFGYDFMRGYTGSYGVSNSLGLAFIDHARNFYHTARDQGLREAFRGLRSFPGDVWNLVRGGWDTARSTNSLGGWTGFAAGVGLPLIAGSAVYSGLNNIRRGRYGAGLLRLMAGAALTYGLYKAYNYSNAYLNNTPNPNVPPDDRDIPAFLRRGTNAGVRDLLNTIHEAQGGPRTAQSHVNVGVDPQVARKSHYAFQQFL